MGEGERYEWKMEGALNIGRACMALAYQMYHWHEDL